MAEKGYYHTYSPYTAGDPRYQNHQNFSPYEDDGHNASAALGPSHSSGSYPLSPSNPFPSQQSPYALQPAPPYERGSGEAMGGSSSFVHPLHKQSLLPMPEYGADFSTYRTRQWFSTEDMVLNSISPPPPGWSPPGSRLRLPVAIPQLVPRLPISPFIRVFPPELCASYAIQPSEFLEWLDATNFSTGPSEANYGCWHYGNKIQNYTLGLEPISCTISMAMIAYGAVSGLAQAAERRKKWLELANHPQGGLAQRGLEVHIVDGKQELKNVVGWDLEEVGLKADEEEKEDEKARLELEEEITRQNTQEEKDDKDHKKTKKDKAQKKQENAEKRQRLCMERSKQKLATLKGRIMDLDFNVPTPPHPDKEDSTMMSRSVKEFTMNAANIQKLGNWSTDRRHKKVAKLEEEQTEKAAKGKDTTKIAKQIQELRAEDIKAAKKGQAGDKIRWLLIVEKGRFG